MRASKVILSIGGGGFTHGTYPELDDICLRFSPLKPNIGYVGWANEDDEKRIGDFYARFEPLAGSMSHLPLGATSEHTRAWLADMKMVYFSGGNTACLVTAILANQSLSAFLTANRSGCVLAGVSAGGVCWFDWILSDYKGSGYEPLQGLSAVSGGICPHYSSEPARKPKLEELVSGQVSQPVYAVDDGACLVAIDGQVDGYFSAHSDRAAYRLNIKDQSVLTSRLPPFA